METASAPDFAIQNTIYKLLQEQPDYRRYLEDMIAEEDRDHDEYWQGWEWEDVHTPSSSINALIGKGIVSVVSKSRVHKDYRLVSLEDTRAALDMSKADEVREYEPAPISDMFKLVYGHDEVKEVLRLAVSATKPVHVMLVGPPGTAKTLLLQDIGRLPGAEWYSGPTTSKAGLVGMLLQCKPRYLIIEELDKMDAEHYTPLLQLMENGVISRLVYGNHERVSLDTRVFADANSIQRIKPMLLSRFAIKDIPAYTPAEFVKVATAVLNHREGLGPNMASLIAETVVRHSTDIRDAVRVARMARNDPRLVERVVQVLWAGRNRAPVTPLARR